MKLFALLLIFIAAANAVDIIVETSPTFDVTPLSEPEVILDEEGLHWEENSWGSNCIFKDDIDAMECTLEGAWPAFAFENKNFKLYSGVLVVNMKVENPDQPIQIQIYYTNGNYESISSFYATMEYVDYIFPIPYNTDIPINKFAIQEASQQKNTFYIRKVVYYPNNLLKKLFSCEISLLDNNSLCKASMNCKADNYGYYLQDGLLTNLSENGCEVISNPLPGYYVDKNEPEKYIKCTNSGCETISKPVEPKNCSFDYDGQLIKNEESVVGLCTKINKLSKEEEGTYVVNSELYTMIPFATTETNYLVHHAIDGDVFNFDRKNDNVYYVVKSNKDAIVFNPEISETDHCADKDGKLMDRVTDFCSNDSSGMYYTCVNGKCTSEYQTEIGLFEENKEKECTCTGTTASGNCLNNDHAAGYYLSETNLYEYKSGENECTKVDNPKDGYYWNDHQYNRLVVCAQGSCSTFTPKLKADITDNSEYESQFVDSGYNLIFNGESLPSILSKPSDKYKIHGNSDSVFNDLTKTYTIKFNKNSAIIDETEELSDIPTDAKPGYYKIAKTNKYYQCDNANGCKEAPIATECNASSIGKLFTNEGKVALCLNFFDNKPIWTNFESSGSKYLMKYNANNNVFGLSNNQYGLIVVTNNSITLSEESKDIHYRYTDANQKVLTQKGCVANAINEFKIVEGEKNIYTLSCVENDNTGLCKK